VASFVSRSADKTNSAELASPTPSDTSSSFAQPSLAAA
jgi:hypothetical protein